MRVEDLYGESSPQPTKRTDTPNKEKEDDDFKINKEDIVKFFIVYFIMSILTGFVRGMGGCEKVNKVY